MKKRSKSLWLMGVSELWSLSEKGIENLLGKAEKTTDILLEKLSQKKKKQVKEKSIQRELLEKAKQHDAEITTANYLLERKEEPDLTETRLIALEREETTREKENEYEL